MSFSYEVKEELVKQLAGVRHCRLAELVAIVSSCGRIYDNQTVLMLQTENCAVASKSGRLLEAIFHIIPDVMVRSRHGKKRQSRHYFLRVAGREPVQRILQALRLTDYEGRLDIQDIAVNGLLLQSSCCKRAFIRGSFLCNGSVSDPDKSYHLEIVCTGDKQAQQLQEQMQAFEISAKSIQRKNSVVVYIKESSQIVDALNVIQASKALLNYENARIKREIKGNVNRQVNCETANITKTISAAHEQIQDIRLIDEVRGLDSLSPELEETAKMRLAYPDYTLKELGEAMSPQVGKSGINHRLRKIKLIADGIRQSD
jgi:hypothetical protein